MSDKYVVATGKDFLFLNELANINENKLVIYGCGINGEVICKYLSDLGKQIEFFVDKQAESREFTVLNKRVISPYSFFSYNNNTKIIVSQDDNDSVVNYLKENGINEDRIVIPFKKINKNIHMIDDNYTPAFYKDSVYEVSNNIYEVTVFTILYNTPRGMLCRTIESVLSQSFTKLRYLIIDNGSTDDSAEIIKKYADKDHRIMYIRLDTNVVWSDVSVISALKKNITTPYVAMVDSDDYYETDFLEKALALSKKDNSDIVQVNTLTYGHEGFRYNYFTHYLGKNICVEGKEKELYLFLRIINVTVWGKLYRSSIFLDLINLMLSYKSDYYRDRNFCLDISWSTYMVLSCKRVSLCDEILHIRTWRKGSSEHSDNHCSKWLSSIVWSFNYLRSCNIKYEDTAVFEDSPLMWLFSLPREKYNMLDFRKLDTENRRVTEFLRRPVCDKFRSGNNE